MAFTKLPIKRIQEKDLDTAIKSNSANGLVKTRKPYTKIRKTFTVTVDKYCTKEEFDELNNLFESVRTVTPFLFTHPTKLNQAGFPMQYTVRFTENITYSQDGSSSNYYEIDAFTLEEV